MILLKILLILLLCIPCYADDSARLVSYPPQKIMGFTGLDTKSNAPLLKDGKGRDMQNVKLSTAFDLKQRNGYSIVNEDSLLDDNDLSEPAITGLFDATFSDGTNFPIVFLGDKIKYDNSSVWTEVGNWWEAPLVTADQDNLFQCIMALDTAICTNDVDVPIEISSTPAKSALDVSDLTDTLTKVKAMTWFRNYLIFGNTVENATERPTRFRWSNVGTTETWTDDDFNDIAELGGDEIIGMAEFYGNLIVFFKNAIYKVTLVGGDDVFNFDKVIDNIGAVARDSIQVVRIGSNQLGIIFLDEDKRIYMFTGLAVVNIGDIIQPTLDNLSAARIQYAQSVYDGESYYLSVSDGSSSTHDLILEYQVEIGEWTKHIDINANKMARVRDGNTPKTYYGNYNAFVYWMDNPDRNNDVDGATGVVDSVQTQSISGVITDAQVIVDASLPSGTYTGATIKITSGTANGEERVILASDSTSVTVATSFSTTPDTTSNYSIGAIDAFYDTKWYDMGDSPRKKLFRELFFWAKEASSNNVTVSFSQDFGTTIDSAITSLAPSSNSLWDTALWDQGIWGTTGDKLYRVRLRGKARTISLRYQNDAIDETFHIYGFNIIGDRLDIR